MPRPNIAFLNDLLQSVGANVRRRPARLASSPAEPAGTRLAAACARLMRPSGEASRIAVAGEALDAFGELEDADRRAFFRSLLDEYSADPAPICDAYAAWDAEPSEARTSPPLRAALRRGRAPAASPASAAEPRTRRHARRWSGCAPTCSRPDARRPRTRARSTTTSRISSPPGSTAASSCMREINWNTPAAILDKIVAYEAVHAIRDWDDLRRRLQPADRRFYAFFHPATGDEPLIFVEVALTARHAGLRSPRCSSPARRARARQRPTPRSSIRSPTARPGCAASPSATS